MLNFIKEYIRKRTLSGMKPTLAGTFLNMQDIHSIGFLYNITSASYEEELTKITLFLDRIGVLYYGLAIETKKGLLPQIESVNDVPEYIKKLEDKEISFVERLYLNWVGVPNSEKIDHFLKRDFDLFISFNDSGDFTMEYILRDVKTKFMVGMHNYPDSGHTLVLEGENKSTLNYMEYLEQIFHYLNIIKAVRQ